MFGEATISYMKIWLIIQLKQPFKSNHLKMVGLGVQPASMNKCCQIKLEVIASNSGDLERGSLKATSSIGIRV